MLHRVIAWALNNPLIVILMGLALLAVGIYSFTHVNVEAYPDPAPAIVEIDTLDAGASASEVERLVTVPMEVTMAGMPHLTYVRTKSLFGLSFMRLQFDYGYPYEQARQEVINRLASQLQPLPATVTPQISPESPTGEIYRYTLNGPTDAEGRDIYTLNDLKALQDWVLEREFRRVPRIVDVTSYGGTVKRYEIHPDPQGVKDFGVTLAQVQAAVQNANQNVGADVVIQGREALPVRSVGLFGGGEDPVNQVLGMQVPDPEALFRQLDTDKDGKVSRKEFQSLFSDPSLDLDPNLDLPTKLKEGAKLQEELFTKYDADKGGSINLDEFKALWKDVQKQVEEEEVGATWTQSSGRNAAAGDWQPPRPPGCARRRTSALWKSGTSSSPPSTTGTSSWKIWSRVAGCPTARSRARRAWSSAARRGWAAFR